MKIRLWGTEEECRLAAELMRTPGLLVLSVSEPRPDRGASALVRVYVEARLDPQPPNARAGQQRAQLESGLSPASGGRRRRRQ